MVFKARAGGWYGGLRGGSPFYHAGGHKTSSRVGPKGRIEGAPLRQAQERPFDTSFDKLRTTQDEGYRGTAEPAPSKIEGPLLRVRRSGGLLRGQTRPKRAC